MPLSKIILPSLVLMTLFVVSQRAYAVDVLVSSLIDTPDPAVRGGEINYAIEIQNQQADTANNVVLRFDIPSDTSFVGVDNASCNHDGGTPGTVICNYGNLLGTAAVPPGPVETANVIIRSSENTGITINVLAEVSTDSTEVNTVNNTLTQNTTIDDGADLSVTFSPAPDPVIAGGNVTYTATVNNTGPNTAISVQIVFNLSVNLTYVAGSANGTGWNCSVSGQQVTCTRSSLNNGSSAPDITFQALVTGAQTGTITSIATVSSATEDPVPNNNVITANVTVNTGVDVAITIVGPATAIIAGSDITMTLRPRNLGPFDADNVQVNYAVPVSFTINGSPAGSGWSCSVSGQDISCTRLIYIVGATDDITVNLTAPSPLTPTNFDHPANISTSTTEAVDRLTNNSNSTTITVNPDGLDLSISNNKGPQPVAQGSNITNYITVHNNGPRDAGSGSITVQIQLDVGNEDFITFSGTNWSCTFSSPNVDCTYIAVLNNGASTSSLTITTIATASGTLSNTAIVSFSGTPGDFDNTNNMDIATVTSTSAIADLALTKVADADNSDGDTNTLDELENSIIYTLTITNNGPNDASGIILTDPIPGFVNGSTTVVVTSQPTNYSCTTGSTVTCSQTSGTLANGASDVFEITVSRPLFDGNQTNNASAFSSAVGDDDRSNNNASITILIEPVADVQVQSKTVSPNPVMAGVEATYSITVINNGPSTAQNVQVVDTFNLASGDTGFTFISASPSQGACTGLTPGESFVAVDAPTLTCDLGNLSRNNSETIVLVIRPNFMASPTNPRTMGNSLTISTSTFDSNSGNDTFGPVVLTIDTDLVDLLINNSDIPDPVAWDPASNGDNFNNDVVYDVEFTNRGPSYATGVNYVYTMTPKASKTVRFDCDEANIGDACGVNADTCSISSGSNPVTGPDVLTLTCTSTTVVGTVDEMTANSTGHRYMHFRLLTKPDSTGDTHNTNATISANEDETILANNAETESTSVRGRVDLEIISNTPNPATVQLDQPFVWTITVVNNGPVDSDQTDLISTLPAGVVFHGAIPSWSNNNDSTNGICSIVSSTLSCDMGLLSVGASVVITVPVLVDTFTNASVENCATATTSGVDVIPNNNTDICGTVTVNNSFFPSDYGDAPDLSIGTSIGDYTTTQDNGGPRHMLPGGTWLGICVDSDGEGSQQDITASADDTNAGIVQAGTCVANDDEDGITLAPALIADQNSNLDIMISGNTCALDGWVDFNADGDFDDTGEQIFNALSLAVGTHTQTIAVPAGIAVGNSYARFRCSAAGGLSPVEETTGGEIEDYLVSLQPNSGAGSSPTDYGDAPDIAIGTSSSNYQTLPTDNGASHVLGIANAPFLGTCVDSDPEVQQNVNADADDLGAAGGVNSPVTTGTCTTAGDDEKGVAFISLLQPGTAASIEVTSSTGTSTCVLNAWIDFNGDGDFTDTGEQIANDMNIATGSTAALTPVIPASAALGFTYARFRCNSAGNLASTGAAVDGEVEDYRVVVQPNLANTAVDFGDTPDASTGEAAGDYSTTEANNGPSHVLGLPDAPYLGACVDSDSGTAQNETADADDVAGLVAVDLTVGNCATADQDEDGVVFDEPLNRGSSPRILVTTGTDGTCVLNGWIDFNQDGVFSGAEKIVSDQAQAAGITEAYQVDVPSGAELGETYARIRCSSIRGIGPVGPAPDGEVEDYLVTISAITGTGAETNVIPTLNRWSLVLLMLLVAWIAFRRLTIRKWS